MPFIKLGESIDVLAENIQSPENVLAEPEILERFHKYAAELKKISPHAKDFLYFTAVMMHAAEAAILEGAQIKNAADGKPLTVTWEKNGESLRWVCSDQNIRPYKNANGDIFPEEELLKAHKKWVGRPLCLDHKSSSVDFVRGVVLDTYYDRPLKRVVALCALDKVNFPDLARKVESGYAVSVSMGTAVGRAICTDCGRVARVESDFCNHMRSKSCYGEINTDLSPIELSIVVNGADPRAKIKHIVAHDLTRAAETLEGYLKLRMTNNNLGSDEIGSLKAELAKIAEKVAELDSNDTNYGTTGSKVSPVEAETDNTRDIAPPPSLADYSSTINDVKVKVSQIYEVLQKLGNEENKMTTKKAYFQGTEEPTPGRVQYPPDPMNVQVRDQDKHMNGQSPFPEVGPVDGMHPGVASSGESEVERKRKLQRLAALKERQMRREAALERSAYFQGGEEPAKGGKPTYPADPMNVQVREKGDKHMNGQPPFPDVGDVDGLHPSPASVSEKSEEARKKTLQRAASLKAKFVRASTPDGELDKDNSVWQVFANDKLILTASVSEITRGNSEALFDSVATRDFGLSMIGKIKTAGFNTAVALYKSAQGAPPPPPAPPVGAAPPPPPAMPMPEGDGDLEEPKGGGSEKESAKDIANDIRELADEASNRAGDLIEALDEMKGEDVGVGPEATPEDFAKADDNAEFGKTASVREMRRMRRSLNGMLVTAFDEQSKTLKAHAQELRIAADMYDNKWKNLDEAQRKYLHSLAADAVGEARQSMTESLELMNNFVKYAQGTESLEKRAAAEEIMRKNAQDWTVPNDSMAQAAAVGMDPDAINQAKAIKDLKNAEDCSYDDDGESDEDEDDANDFAFASDDDSDKDEDEGCAADGEDDSLDVNDVGVDGGGYLVDKATGKRVNQPVAGLGATAGLRTKADRATYRAKLAQKGLKFSDMLGKAHPKGGVRPGGIANNSELSVVENLEEAKDAHMGVANATAKVRKQAERIAALVSQGKIERTAVDALVAHGVDPEAVKYYKAMWGQSDAEGKQWAGELVKEHMAKKAAAAAHAEHVKIKRAYELAYEMKERGLIAEGSLKDKVDELLKFNDEAFESMKRLTATASFRKNAMPQVGLIHSDDVLLPMDNSSESKSELVSAFEDYFAGKRL